MSEQPAPKRVVVRGGTLVDETGARRGDVAIEDGRIVEVAPSIDARKGALVLDAAGCLVSPGLVDLHTHLREPGNEVAETIATGTRAAATGGYTAVLAMPNTTPAIDSAALVRDVRELARDACVEVAVAGAITVGRAGEQLVPFFEMAELGVRIFTDDGSGVQDAGVLRRAVFKYASDLDVVLAEHCEDDALAHHGHMHEGEWSSRLGIPAQPALAEEAMVARDLALVRLTRARMHFLHLSTAGSVALVASAKREGLAVSAEVTPHHLTLTDAEVASFDPRFKMNPPLRTPTDLSALLAGLGDGTIDAIATDHAPHTQASKEAPFDAAPPGVIGLETALAVCHDALVTNEAGEQALSYQELIGRFSWQPARIAGLDQSSGQGGPLVAGALAHLCVFDPTAAWVVGATPFASRSANSPFVGRTLTGRVRHTIYAGEPVVIDGEATR